MMMKFYSGIEFVVNVTWSNKFSRQFRWARNLTIGVRIQPLRVSSKISEEFELFVYCVFLYNMLARQSLFLSLARKMCLSIVASYFYPVRFYTVYLYSHPQ